ncbi:hypothetical protein D1872_297390 [compost metagenome]
MSQAPFGLFDGLLGRMGHRLGNGEMQFVDRILRLRYGRIGLQAGIVTLRHEYTLLGNHVPVTPLGWIRFIRLMPFRAQNHYFTNFATFSSTSSSVGALM